MAKKTSRRSVLRSGSLLGSIGLIAGYSIFIERLLIFTNTYRIKVPNLPTPFSGLRIVQLSDLHYGPLVPLSTIREVVKRALALAPDLILCTGDYVHERHASKQIDEVWPVLSQLEAPLGVFSVLGNHDHWADPDRSRFWLKQSGQDLDNKVRFLQKGGSRLWLVGTGDLWEDPHPLDDQLETIPENECRIVLAHNPDTADTGFTHRVDLMLSGHTHGGQIRLPFLGAPSLPVRNKRYASGLITTLSGMQLFISRGIGWAIVPVRFNCPPEIAVLELVPA